MLLSRALVLPVLGTLLAGCAGSGAPASAESTTPTTPPSSAAVPAVERPCAVRVGDRPVPLTRAQAQALTEAAVRVQRESMAVTSAAEQYGAALGDTSVAAADLVRPLSGAVPATLTCEVERTDQPDQEEGPSGLTPHAERLRQRVYDAFGRLPMGGFAAGGVSSGHVDDSAHYDGRAMDIFFRPVTASSTARGWVLAHWLVAHGDRNELLSVIFSDRIWTSWASCAGWRDYEHPGGPTRDPVLRHLDHVHTAVQGARPQRTLSAEEERERQQRRPACARS